MKHIVIVRKSKKSPSFLRIDSFSGEWISVPSVGQPLRSLIHEVKDDVSPMNCGVTISSFRSQDDLSDHENLNIPDDTYVIVLCPIEGLTMANSSNGLRMWGTLNWSSPDIQPILGEKMREKAVVEWLDGYFNDDCILDWNLGRSNFEVWIRPDWNARKMFPELFGDEPEAKTERKPKAVSKKK